MSFPIESAFAYSGTGFFSFFSVLLQRLLAAVLGQIPIENIASDEIQLLALIGIAVSSAVVGTFLIFRRMTMLANALSHTLVLGIVVTFLLIPLGFMGDPLSMPLLTLVALLTGLVTTFLAQFFQNFLSLSSDASVGLIFTSLFALGIVFLSRFAKDAHVGAELVMGNVDALQRGDLWGIYGVLLLTLCITLLFSKELLLSTFDPALARAQGFSPLFFHYLLMMLVSLVAITAFKAVGVILFLSFLVTPPLIARLFTKSFYSCVTLGACIGALLACLSVACSRSCLTWLGIGLSTSGIAVVLLGFFYLFALFVPRRLTLTTRQEYTSPLERSPES